MAVEAQAGYTPEQQALLAQLYRSFITGNHILHKHGILDAYGHMSVRHPFKPDVFIMARYIPPALISSSKDLVEYWISDATPLDPTAPKGYSERCIHSECLKAYPEINVVIHSHNPAVTPYSSNGIPFLPVTQQGGFLGPKPTPIFEIQKYYREGDKQNMHIDSVRLGSAMASYFSPSGTGKIESPLVLLRGHGLVLVAPRIEDCVKRAIAVQNNARMLTTGLTARAGYESMVGEERAKNIAPVIFMSPKECEGGAERSIISALRPWALWSREVQVDPLYVNQGYLP